MSSSSSASHASTLTEQGYVPTEEWPDVTAMIEGFGEPSLPASDALEGPAIDIEFENGWTITHRFHQGELTWTITAGGEATGATGTHPYRAVEARPGIFFVDFIKGDGVHSVNVSMVIDRTDGRVTVAESSFVDRKGAVRMKTDFLSGRVSGTGEIETRPSSSKLVGKRIYYRYSPVEHYEHYYLNAGTFVWHCVKGGEAGLADADPTRPKPSHSPTASPSSIGARPSCRSSPSWSSTWSTSGPSAACSAGTGPPSRR